MSDKKEFMKEVLWNAVRFLINIGFVMLFQIIFHAENTLLAVALGVGFTMLPVLDTGMRPMVMVSITVILFIGGGIAGQSALLPPVLAFVVNFSFLCCL